MIRYTLKRLVIAAVTLFLVATFTWVLMQYLPGSPFNDDKLTETARAQLNAKYGLDDPLWEQYTRYIGNMLHGDFGISFQYNGRAVTDIIFSRLPVSAFLGVQALIVGTVVGLILGAVAAIKQNSLIDRVASFLSVLGISLPVLVLAPVANYLLAFKLGWFPIAFFDSWWHSVLPSLILATLVAATVATYTRTEMLEVIGQDFVTLAKSKGMSETSVIIKHVLRNSMIPLVTILLPLAAALVTGTLIVESVFAIPGIGDQFVRSIQVNDYSMIIGTTMLFAVFFVASYLIQDVLYGLIDPRIRVGGNRG